MASIVVGIVFIFAAWIFGDWRNWRKYLPTIQYFIGSDMLYNLLTQDYLLWSFPHPPNVLPNHIATSLFRMFTTYPSFVLVYLNRFPNKGILHRIRYMALWLVFWALDELYLVKHGLLIYNHGWTYAWSILFLCAMLPLLQLHHTKPLMAYILSVPITVFLLLWFHVPAFNA